MDEKQTLYRMNRLLRIAEIEAYSARTNVGSRAEYFALLTTFIEAAPSRVEELIAALKVHNAELFQRNGYELRKMLLAIGANGLLWETERTAELSRSGLWKECAERAVLLASRVKRLVEQLVDTRARPGETLETEDDGKTSAPFAGRDARLSGLPRSPIEPERFENIRSLLDTPREAMDYIRDLMRFSYNLYVDALLASLHECLSKREWENAKRQFDSLMRSVLEPHDNIGRDEKKKRILAIDDAPDILHFINTILRDEYTVYCATNHMAALKVLANSIPNLIILDIEMPDINGFDMAWVIRKLKSYEATPLFFLSANATMENVVKSRQVGISDFVKKPIEPPFLLSKVRQHLPHIG